MTAEPTPRASALGTILGLLAIGTLVAIAGLWLKQYTHDRRQMWVLNPSKETAVVTIDGVPRTLLSGEIQSATAPRKPTFDIHIKTASVQRTLTVTRTPSRQEVLLLDLAPSAAYVTLDVTPRYAPTGSPPNKRLNQDGRSFRPKIIDVRSPAQLIRLTGGEAATIGPLEGLPPTVWLARRYARSVHKIMRLPPPQDGQAAADSVERKLADGGALTELETGVAPRSVDRRHR